MASIVVHGHLDASYNGKYRVESFLNRRPAYKNSKNRSLYYYCGSNATSYSFDDREPDGTQDWFHGGWTPPLPGGNVPLGKRVWSLSGPFGNKSMVLTLSHEDVRPCATIAVSGHSEVKWNGEYVQQFGLCNREPVYIKHDGMVLYRYDNGVGASSVSLDDRQQNGGNDWFRGGWLHVRPSERVLDKLFGTRVWTMIAREGEDTIRLRLTYRGSATSMPGRGIAQIAKNLQVEQGDVFSAVPSHVTIVGDTVSIRVVRGMMPNFTSYCFRRGSVQYSRDQMIEFCRAYTGGPNWFCSKLNIGLAWDHKASIIRHSECINGLRSAIEYFGRIHKAVEEYNGPKFTRVFRGVDLTDEEFNEMKKVGHFYIPSFTSTSIDPSMAFDKNTTLEIDVASASHYMEMDAEKSVYASTEQEVLLTCYSHYKIIRIDETRTPRHIYLKVI